ncbi:MAG: hypothetical protein M3Y19_00685 [Actinomycetota bacterium]|nr:hypothetical protein [Actinomycetota bacterium]
MTQPGSILVNGNAILESGGYFAARCFTKLDGTTFGASSPITTASKAVLDEPVLQNGRFGNVTVGPHTVTWFCGRQSGDASATLFDPVLDIWSTQ